MHKPAAATLPSSQQFPQLPFTVQDSWSPILFSGVKQIQNKLVRSFSYFTSSQKTEVCERFNLKITTVLFLVIGSVNFRAGKNLYITKSFLFKNQNIFFLFLKNLRQNGQLTLKQPYLRSPQTEGSR